MFAIISIYSRDMFSLLLFVVISSSWIIVDAQNQTIDCKKVDIGKFKELFDFNYGGGSKGLFLDFHPKNASDKFEAFGCKFVIKDTKISEYPLKSYRKQKDKKKLGGLKPCIKYEVTLKIHNPVSKKDFDYKNYVYTKIEPSMKLKLLLSQSNSSSATFTWNFTNTDGSCFVDFNVVLKNRNNEEIPVIIDTKDKLITATNLSPCDVYTIELSAISGRNEQVKTDVLTFTLKTDNEDRPKDVEMIVDEISTESVKVSWMSSSSASCLKEHQIFVYDNANNLITVQNVFGSSAIIGNLSQCTNYSLELIDSEKSVLAETLVTTPVQFPLDGVKVTVNHLKAEISWSKLANRDCILNFEVTYKPESCNGEDRCNATTKIIDRENNMMSVASLPPSELFSLMFLVNQVTSHKSGAEENHIMKKLTFNTIARDAFQVSNINEFRTSIGELQITWFFDESLLKFLDHFKVTFNDQVHVTKKKIINFKVAACKTNYTIKIQCVGQDGFTGDNVTYHTNLQDDQTTSSLSSLNGRISHKQKDPFTVIVSWMPSANELSCIQSYEIDIENGRQFNTSETSVEIKITPCRTYKIKVTPISHGGVAGQSATHEFSGDPIIPSSPTSFRITKNAIDHLRFSVGLTEIDKNCYANVIEVRCDDVISEKPIEHIREEDSEFPLEVSNLDPATKYSCISVVKNSIGVSVPSKVLMVSTEEKAVVPKPVVNILATTLDDNTVSLEWKSASINPDSETYKLYVTRMGDAKHSYYSTSYDCGDEAPTVHTKIETSSTKYHTLRNLIPFSNYSLMIKAKNREMESDFSENIRFNTKEAPPSRPRDVKVTFDEGKNDEAKVYAKLSWKPPCQFNGLKSAYKINIIGQRSKFPDHEIELESATEDLDLDLNRDFNYTLTVRASNRHFEGETISYSFRTPSGILSDFNVANWLKIDADQRNSFTQVREFFVRESLFKPNVIGASFLIFNASDICGNQPPLLRSGYISAGNTTLPKRDEYESLQCNIIYQQTGMLPNPLDPSTAILDQSDDFNVKYTFGNGECIVQNNETICNPPLPLNSRVGIILRVHTENGFKDSKEILYLNCESSFPETLTATAIILGGLMILFITICILCCCSKRDKKIIEDESPVETDDLLSFTSYCVIDKNPSKHSNV